MSDHRLVAPVSLACINIRRPFSNFDYVEGNLGGRVAIRRLFSQSRNHHGKTLVIEDIRPDGLVTAENAEIVARYPDYKMVALKRVTFWRRSFTSERQLARLSPKDLIGYAILKRDVVPKRKIDAWHVFDSVFRKYPHEHNCVPAEKNYSVRVGGQAFDIPGVLYCQQNNLNKACAQVALRTLCSLHVAESDLPYARINKLAAAAMGPFDPADGLKTVQIRAVLRGLGIEFRDVDYTEHSKGDRQALPYQKYLYAGVESGAGALLGFKLKGPKAEGRHHIIPFIGHTFNADTWVPNADVSYFHVGERTKYIPSESWLSSFIGHDDNFGSNFCVPRHYVTRTQAQYVVALQPHGVAYSGVAAEAVAVDYLYSMLPKLAGTGSPWLERLVHYAARERQQVVLRAISLTKSEYIGHLRRIRDWQRRHEAAMICDLLTKHLPAKLWLVEVSVPELFAANQRKVGEIVLDAGKGVSRKSDFNTYRIARFPGRFLWLKGLDSNGKPDFFNLPSGLKSHTPLYRTE